MFLWIDSVFRFILYEGTCVLVVYVYVLEYYPNQLHGSSRRHPHPDFEYMRGSLGSDGWRGHWEREGGSLSATGYKRGSSPLPTTLYLLPCTGWVGMPGVQLVSYLRGCSPMHLGPTSYLSGKVIKQSKHYPSCNQALYHIVSECLSSGFVQFVLSLLQSMWIHHDAISSPALDLWDCLTNKMQGQPGPARSTRCQIGGVCFLHLGGGEQEGGKHEHVSHAWSGIIDSSFELEQCLFKVFKCFILNHSTHLQKENICEECSAEGTVPEVNFWQSYV